MLKTTSLYRSFQLFLIFMFLILSGCKNGRDIYVNGTLADAFSEAKAKNKYLYVVSTNDECTACDDYYKTIKNNESIIKGVMRGNWLIYFCEISQPENQLLTYVTGSVASPAAFMFDPEGKLINYILGNRKANEIIKKLESATDLGHVIEPEYKGLTLLVNDLLYVNRIVLEPKSSDDELTKSLVLIKHIIANQPSFYSYYLASKLSLKIKDYKSARYYSEIALSFNDAKTKYIFKSLLREFAQVQK